MKKTIKKEVFLILVCFILLLIVNYNYLDSKLEEVFSHSQKKQVVIERVIDGDTVTYKTNNSEEKHVRLLGINTPEIGENYYSEAKEFLKKRILNKSVELVYEGEDTDRYGRELAFVFIKNKNINLEIVEKGLGNYYFPSGKNKNYRDFVDAWKDCLKKETNLCEFSEKECSECIKVKDFDKWEQEIVFYNSCDFECDLTNWSVKDEGRKKYLFPDFILNSKEGVVLKVEDGQNTDNTLYWRGEDYVLTASGDTIFLRDEKGKLILWKIIE